MQMTENEIVKSFRNSDKKREQIRILAELNVCSREKIREILLRNGIMESELPKPPGKKTVEKKPKGQELAEEKTTSATYRPAQETKEPEEQKLFCVVPEVVKQVCRERISCILQFMKTLEDEKRELQKFLEDAEKGA